MVSNLEIHPLLEFVIDINKIYTIVRPAKKFISKGVTVKGKRGVLELLKRTYPKISAVVEKRAELSNVSTELHGYITKMEKRYGEPATTINPLKPIALTMGDAKRLVESVDNWLKQIFRIYSKPPTKVIKLEELRQIVDTLSIIVDEQSRKDLEDAYDCIINNFPTPAVMILYRIGESKVKELYKKEMKEAPTKPLTMGSMARDLREKQEVEIRAHKRDRVDPLIHYIISQTEERNFVQHPIKRYEQNEAEETFIFVKKLITGIHEMLEDNHDLSDK